MAAKTIVSINEVTETADQRRSGREIYYASECIEISFNAVQNKTSGRGYLVDISANGIGLALDSVDKSLLNETISLVPQCSEIGGFRGKVVQIRRGRYSGRDMELLGIQFVQEANTVTRALRFASPVNLKTVCSTWHPFRFGQYITYNICDFSADGMCLSTNIPAYILPPCMTFNASVFMPGYKVFDVRLETKNVREAGGQILIGVKFVDPEIRFLKSISSYLLMNAFETVTLDSLRENGFIIDNDITKVTRLSFVTNEKQWNNFLSLRLEAQQREGRWLNESNPLNTVDSFDDSARHMMVNVGPSIVAIGRIVFNDGKVEKAEHFPRVKIPDFIVEGGFVEASRFATHPNYRGTNLFPMLIQHCLRVAMESRVKYVLANCEDSLVPIYKRFGARTLGIKFYTPFMERKALNLMYFDVHDAAQCRKVNLVIWYLFFKPFLLLSLKARGDKLNRFSEARIKALEFFGRMIVEFRERQDVKKLELKRSKRLTQRETKNLVIFSKKKG